uniref:Sushi domain-containing protein n=1 Tax=Varanus komodoensis TaxID=61221 RepID=A0A8D2KYJ7_VARKO
MLSPGPITCSPPPNISHSSHDGESIRIFAYNSTVTYKCDHGFSLMGDASIRCATEDKISGVWEGSKPECKGKNNLSLKQETLYRLVGQEKARCVVTGNTVSWSGAIPFCQPILCYPPPVIPNGTHSGTDDEYSFGNAVTYRCDAGFSLIGSASISCSVKANGVDGEWKPNAPECKGNGSSYVRCNRPQIPNGRVASTFQSTYLYDNIIRIECDPHHTLQGSDFIKCGADSKWKPDVPTCVKSKYSNGLKCFLNLFTLRCVICLFPLACQLPLPPPPAYQFNIYSLAFYTYSLTLSSAILCYPPPKIAHGRHSGEDDGEYTYGSSVTYRCDAGFSLIGSASISCSVKANDLMLLALSLPLPPSLSDVKCKRPTIPNGMVASVFQAEYVYDNVIKIVCDAGYTLLGSEHIKCGADNSWKPAVPTCAKEDQRVMWTGDIPICQRIPCFPPPKIPHGKHTGIHMDDFFYGTAVTYTCEAGYPLVGHASIYCTTKDGQNGVWSSRWQALSLTSCSSPEIANGKIVAGASDTYAYNQKVVFDCKDGYRLVGSRESHCQADGTWDPPLPICERVVHCQSPEIPNGKIVSGASDTYGYKQRVVFDCNDGHRLAGSRESNCQADGTWDPPLPVCKRGKYGYVGIVCMQIISSSTAL